MQKIYTGISYHTLDSKNRLFIPPKLRAQEKQYVLTCGIDNCIVIYSFSQWKNVVNKIDNLTLKNKHYQRSFVRMFFAEAEIVEIDNQGRILIPQKFKQRYKIKQEVVLIGNRDKLEIWSKDEWSKYSKQTNKIIQLIKTEIVL
ncbi:MAG: division/cell wall cluster transcriptional repressor MraZ [Endomicrobia bacterium]|nr:division/cell wall cluster transcriptional repressor MraZ [Endomicrobiia bacterium]MCX7940431.1 division/cell wall cluster transcriptional repressor MraZ [Endomicrobiia bacterium]MDW8055876.1 division/cell wall cluster transcriptional repressor MraZ [Elusimicrobiota bacterium]